MKVIPSEIAQYNREIARKLRHIFTPVCEKLSTAANNLTEEEIQNYVTESLVAIVDYKKSKYDIYTESTPAVKFFPLGNNNIDIPKNISEYFNSFLKHLNEVAVNKPYNIASFLNGSFKNYLWSPIYNNESEANNHAAETLVVPVGEYGVNEALLMLLTTRLLCRLTDKLAQEALKIEAKEWTILSEETLRGRKKAEKIQEGLKTEVISVLDSLKEGIQSIQATVSSLTAKKVGDLNFETLLKKIFEEKFPQKIAYKVPFSYTLPSIRQGIFHEHVFENNIRDDGSLKLSNAYLAYCKETQALYQESRIFVDGKRMPGLLGTGCPLAQKENGYAHVGINYVSLAYFDLYKILKQMVNTEVFEKAMVGVEIEQARALPHQLAKPDEFASYNINSDTVSEANEKLAELTEFHQLTQDVLMFWFDQIPLVSLPSKEKRTKWFNADESFDATVTKKFGELIEAVSNGKFLILRRSPTETVALIILLDQLSRNAFRGTPKSYAQDELALALAKELVDSGCDKTLPLAARWFVYMPYQHSESLEIQQESMALFKALYEDANTEEENAVFAEVLQYAQEHESTIKQFGRFPYRNVVLGRETSSDEQQYLDMRSKSIITAQAGYLPLVQNALTKLYNIGMGLFSKSTYKVEGSANKNILVINASPKIEGSDSRVLSQFFVDNWSNEFPDDQITFRDVGKNPIPHLTHDSIETIQSPHSDANISEDTRELSLALIAEIKAADTIIISVPMYNGSIPSGLKAYFDHIAVDSLTWGGVKYGADKKVLVITTGGGNHVGTERDFVTPYMKYFLSTIDLNTVEFIHAHKLCCGDEAKTASLELAKKGLKDFVTHENQVRGQTKMAF